MELLCDDPMDSKTHFPFSEAGAQRSTCFGLMYPLIFSIWFLTVSTLQRSLIGFWYTHQVTSTHKRPAPTGSPKFSDTLFCIPSRCRIRACTGSPLPELSQRPSPHPSIFMLGLCPLIFLIIKLCHTACFVSTLQTYTLADVLLLFTLYLAHSLAYSRLSRIFIALLQVICKVTLLTGCCHNCDNCLYIVSTTEDTKLVLGQDW